MTKARDIADGAAGTVNLSGYATTNDLTNYALTTDLAGYATTSDLATKLDGNSTLNPSKLDSTGTIPSALLAGVGGGIDLANSYRLDNDVTITSTGYTTLTNWEKADSSSSGSIGSDLSHSSGVFTFPETGIYYIAYSLYGKLENNESYLLGEIQGTTDNSNYETLAASSTSIYRESDSYQSSATAHVLFDCTDTTTHKVRFGYNPALAPATSKIIGSTNENRTSFVCIKLGDT
jgi:hypothetical protein